MAKKKKSFAHLVGQRIKRIEEGHYGFFLAFPLGAIKKIHQMCGYPISPHQTMVQVPVPFEEMRQDDYPTFPVDLLNFYNSGIWELFSILGYFRTPFEKSMLLVDDQSNEKWNKFDSRVKDFIDEWIEGDGALNSLSEVSYFLSQNRIDAAKF